MIMTGFGGFGWCGQVAFHIAFFGEMRLDGPEKGFYRGMKKSEIFLKFLCIR